MEKQTQKGTIKAIVKRTIQDMKQTRSNSVFLIAKDFMSEANIHHNIKL
jgi:hypothetical protein